MTQPTPPNPHANDPYYIFLKTLKDKGATEEDIMKAIANMNQLATTKLYTEFMALLSEDEIKDIDSCANQEEANSKIATIFKEKTGKDQDQVKIEMLNDIAREYLKATENAGNPSNSENMPGSSEGGGGSAPQNPPDTSQNPTQ
jgi:hypothetical protein